MNNTFHDVLPAVGALLGVIIGFILFPFCDVILDFFQEIPESLKRFYYILGKLFYTKFFPYGLYKPRINGSYSSSGYVIQCFALSDKNAEIKGAFKHLFGNHPGTIKDNPEHIDTLAFDFLQLYRALLMIKLVLLQNDMYIGEPFKDLFVDGKLLFVEDFLKLLLSKPVLDEVAASKPNDHPKQPKNSSHHKTAPERTK